MEEVKELPDDVWVYVFQTGIQRSNLSVQDICSLCISSKKFKKLSDEDILWSSLVAQDFPTTTDIDNDGCNHSAFSKKSLYKCQLRNKLKQKLDSTRLDISRVNHRLREARNSYRRSSYLSLITLDKKLEKMAKEFVEYACSAVDNQNAVKLLEEQLQTKSKKFKEHFTSLLGKIKARLHGECSAPLCAPASVPTDLVDIVDFVDCVETKLRDLLGDGQNSEEDMKRLYVDRDELVRKLAALASRLKTIGFPDGAVDEVVQADVEVILGDSHFGDGGKGDIELSAKMHKLTLIDYFF